MAAMRVLLRSSENHCFTPLSRTERPARDLAGQTALVNARSALFDLYGDHLAGRGGQAPVAALVRCLGALEIAPPAVRTAVSRMVRQDWLVAVRTPAGPGYALTPRAVNRLDEAAARIYRTRDQPWDGRWQLLTVERVRERSRRDRLRAGLRYLGYGAIDDTTWLAPRPSSELAALLDAEQIRAEVFTASHDGSTEELVSRVWDLGALAASYRQWLDEAHGIAAAADPPPSDQAGFAARSRLVHEWRKFLFTDPWLPDELLPADWIGRRAAGYFDDQATRLLPSAARFIDRCLEPDARRTHE
jgi:phenylacetic acid degradation operon negative regulatory protein